MEVKYSNVIVSNFETSNVRKKTDVYIYEYVNFPERGFRKYSKHPEVQE